MNAQAKPSGATVRDSSIARLTTSLLRFFQYRGHYKTLETLPDYLLRDIGLTRADIARASQENRPF
jgi:uncharacterized protein YjiS (DUF1127 family)